MEKETWQPLVRPDQLHLCGFVLCELRAFKKRPTPVLCLPVIVTEKVCATVDPGYIKLQGDGEIVLYIDNSKYKICLPEAYLKTPHITENFLRS